jgi:hypothetical protein
MNTASISNTESTHPKTRPIDSHGPWRGAVCCIMLLATWAWLGCGRPPAVEQNNLPLISSLRTALSARNTEWLKGVERAVAERRDSNLMSEDSAQHFNHLIQLARDGDWEASEHACLAFEKAQMNRNR